MMKIVLWVPRKNTERSSVSKFGSEWEAVTMPTLNHENTACILVRPLGDDKLKDLRWIDKNQITNERWEVEPL